MTTSSLEQITIDGAISRMMLSEIIERVLLSSHVELRPLDGNRAWRRRRSLGCAGFHFEGATELLLLLIETVRHLVRR